METGYKRNKLFAKGGMVDLFEDYENIPPKIARILEKYEDAFDGGDYKGLSMALGEVEANGYTFEYNLSGEAYGLRPKNVPLNKLDGYEDEEYAKGGTVEVDVESLQEELRSLKVRIKSLEEKNTSEAYEQSKKLRSQLSYIQARLLHLGVGSTSFAQGGTVGKYTVESNLYKPYKSDKFITYYYVVDENNKTINKNTGKIYRGKQMDNYKFSSREEAQKYADSLNKTQSKSGSTMKFSAIKCAEKLADLSYEVWNKLNIDSGSEIYSSDATQKELAKEYRTAGIDKMFIEYNAKQRKEIAEALTDENQHSLRNYLALKGYLGEEEMANYVRIAKNYNKKGGSRNVLNPEIIKPTVSDISVYVPNRNILSITIEKDGKEMKLTGSDIMDGLYVKDGEFKRGGFIKTLRRWWKKLNGTWYYNEGNGWRRDRAFQNKSEDYEKGGRRTYKQVIRGYVDDTPYEYAKGGYVDIEGKLLKELQKLQRDLNSSRLQTYIEGDNSEEAMANKRERASKMARFNEVLAMLNDIQAKRKSEKFARGGDVQIPEKIEYSSMFSPIPRSTDNEKVV